MLDTHKERSELLLLMQQYCTKNKSNSWITYHRQLVKIAAAIFPTTSGLAGGGGNGESHVIYIYLITKAATQNATVYWLGYFCGRHKVYFYHFFPGHHRKILSFFALPSYFSLSSSSYSSQTSCVLLYDFVVGFKVYIFRHF